MCFCLSVKCFNIIGGLTDWLGQQANRKKHISIAYSIKWNERKWVNWKAQKIPNETDTHKKCTHENEKNSYAMDHHGFGPFVYSFFPWFYQSLFSFVVVSYAVRTPCNHHTHTHFLRHNLSKCKLISIAKICFVSKIISFSLFCFSHLFTLSLFSALRELFSCRFAFSISKKTQNCWRHKRCLFK